jgi:iron complex outermembrane recepter protein
MNRVRATSLVLALLALARPMAVNGALASADSAVIEGVVVDATTGAALPGTHVRIVGLGRADLTHERGEFHLLNLPAGRHTVLFERLGYRQEVRVVDLARRQVVSLRVEMRVSAIPLQGLVITGTAQPQLGEQAVRPTTVLSGQELARRLDATLAGTLQHEAGLAVTSIGPATARPVIRGLGGDRVLVLEDGTRTGDLSSASGDHAVALEPLTAQRIEVVRGPAALLYGSNAIGGVINVIREEVPASLPDRPTGMFSLQGQTMNRGLAAGASAQLGTGSLSLRGEGSFRTAGDLHTPQGDLDNTDLQSYSLAAGAAHVGGRDHIGLAYRFYDNAYGIPGGFVGSHPEGVRIEMRRHSMHGEAHLRRDIGAFRLFDINVKYTNYHHRELEAGGILGTEFGLLAAAVDAVARHDRVGPFASGVIGTRFGWQDYAAGGSTDTPPSVEWSAAGFLLEELDVGPLRLQAGARVDWHRVEPLDTETELDIGDVRTRTFASVSASLGGLYSLSSAVVLGASIARAYRTPDFGELFSQGPHLAAYSFEVGNPDLDAETGIGVDVFMRVAGERLSGEIAAFRNALTNYIYYRDTGEVSRTGLPIYQATGADALLYGFEGTLSVEPLRHVVVSGTSSYVRGTLASIEQPLPMIPPLQGRVTARYERPRYFVGAGWRGAAAQERVAAQEFETVTPGHNVMDVDAGYRWLAFGRIHTLTFRVDNITDAVVFEHLSRIRERDSGRRAPGAGRGASLVYRVVF